MSTWQDSNQLPTTLNARWFVLRHGHSEANQQGLVTSQLANAEHQFGLTPAGQAEVRTNITAAKNQLQTDDIKLIVSPFLRTRETADIVSEILGVSYSLDARLCERNFGDFELKPDTNYPTVWARDIEDAGHTDWNVESVHQVLARSTQLVAEADATMQQGSVGILVTHGDVAAITTCGFLKVDPSGHRGINPIKTAQLMELRCS